METTISSLFVIKHQRF